MSCLECNKRASFNVEGAKKALYCKDHQKGGMVDVIHKTCLECNKQPVFNVEGAKKALYCKDHQKEGMVDVKHKTCKSGWCSIRVTDKYDWYCLFCYMN